MSRMCAIPIKEYSERLKDKNFLLIGGKPLYQHMLLNILEASCYDLVCVDTDSNVVKDFCRKNGITVIDRLPKFSTNTAHGNGILMHDYNLYPNYDLYFQMHVTNPFLKPETIRDCVESFENNLDEYDSVFTATIDHSHLWLYDQPLYRLDTNPRTQDGNHIYKESSGIFGTTKESFLENRKRTGGKVLKYIISDIEAVDIDYEIDLLFARVVYDKIQNGETVV